MKRKYDVCVVTTIHPENEKRIYQRCTLVYKEFGFNVCIIAPWKMMKPEDNITLISTDFPKTRASRLRHGYNTFIRCIQTDASVFHIHDIDFLPWAALLKRIKRISIVYDCHENYPEEIVHGKGWIPNYMRRPLAYAVRSVENSLSRYIENVVAVVPHQVERFTKIGCNVTLVRNLSSFKFEKLSETGMKGIAYFGSISPNYGLKILISLVKRYAGAQRRGNLFLAIKFLDTQSRIEFLHETIPYKGGFEFVENAGFDVIKKFALQSVIGLALEQSTPEKNLAFPAKLFEYMKFGFAIVSSDAEMNKKIIQSSGAGILCTADRPEEFMDAIDLLMSNEDLLKGYSRKSLQASTEEYSWENEKIKLVKMIEDLLVNQRSVNSER